MADVYLPGTLMPLFPGLPRRLDVEAATVGEAIDRLNGQWPGLLDRLCEPGRVSLATAKLRHRQVIRIQVEGNAKWNSDERFMDGRQSEDI